MRPNSPHGWKQKLRAIPKLIRWKNLAFVWFAQFSVAACLIEPEPFKENLFQLALASVVTLLVTAAGYVINDYYDVKVDSINKPERVTIGLVFSRPLAIFAHSFLNGLAMFLSIFLGWKIWLLFLGSSVLLWWYSNALKRLPLLGNAAIASLSAVSILIPALITNNNRISVGAFALFAFFFTLVREIIKDMAAIKGDQRFGSRTLPIVLGIAQTKRLIYALGATFTICLMALTYSLMKPLIVYYLLLGIPLVFFLRQLWYADTSKKFVELSRFSKVLILAGIGSMWLLVLYRNLISPLIYGN